MIFLNSDLDLELARSFHREVRTAKTPGGGTVTLDGKAGPVNVIDAADTPFQATAVVSHLDVASTGFIDPASGLAGLIESQLRRWRGRGLG